MLLKICTCDVIHVFFTHDEIGRVHRITDADKLTNGQATWAKTQMMVFAGYFYDEQFFQQQIEAAGLRLQRIENYTILRREELLTITLSY